MEYAVFGDVARVYGVENTNATSDQCIVVRIRSTSHPGFKLVVMFSTNLTRGLSASVVESDASRMVVSIGLWKDPSRLVIELSTADTTDRIAIMVFLGKWYILHGICAIPSQNTIVYPT